MGTGIPQEIEHSMSGLSGFVAASRADGHVPI